MSWASPGIKSQLQFCGRGSRELARVGLRPWTKTSPISESALSSPTNRRIVHKTELANEEGSALRPWMRSLMAVEVVLPRGQGLV